MLWKGKGFHLSKPAKMKHFWHQLVNVALSSEEAMAPSCPTGGSAYGEALGQSKGDLKK